jgi:hypothetical protein
MHYSAASACERNVCYLYFANVECSSPFIKPSNKGQGLKTVIRGAKIIFSVTLRVIMGSVGFIAHKGNWGVGSPFSSVLWSSVPRKMLQTGLEWVILEFREKTAMTSLGRGFARWTRPITLPPIAHEGFCLVYGKPLARFCPRWKSAISTLTPLLMLETVQCLHILRLWCEGPAARPPCHKAHAPFAAPWHLHSASPQNL